MSDPSPVDPSAEALRRWREDSDPDALDLLLRLETETLKRMLRSRRPTDGGATTVSDIAQQAVLGLLAAKTPPSFDDPRALRAYLWRSAWRLLLRRFERESRRPTRVSSDELERAERAFAGVASLGDADREERAAAVELAVNLLPAEAQALLRGVYFQGLDIAAAGRAVGLSREAANSRLVRARRQLAEKLAAWAEVIG
jgi:RNA polymerase sigma factor (sigma-70 family)